MNLWECEICIRKKLLGIFFRIIDSFCIYWKNNKNEYNEGIDVLMNRCDFIVIFLLVIVGGLFFVKFLFIFVFI